MCNLSVCMYVCVYMHVDMHVCLKLTNITTLAKPRMIDDGLE